MRNTPLVLVVAVLLATVRSTAAAGVAAEGATPGEWTMDLDVATKMAAEKKLPILLNFSGSDWCGWCQVMETNVFSAQKWNDYAKDNLMMVLIDFPTDPALVPQKFVKRNEELKAKYAVEGLPTFIVLDDDATTVLGQFGASEDATPESFAAGIQVLLRYRPSEVAKYTKTLSSADKATYKKMIVQMSQTRQGIAEQEQLAATAQKQIEDLKKKAVILQETAAEFRASKLGPETLKQYKELKATYDAAEKKIADWIATQPERNQENVQKYQAMVSELSGLDARLSMY